MSSFRDSLNEAALIFLSVVRVSGGGCATCGNSCRLLNKFSKFVFMVVWQDILNPSLRNAMDSGTRFVQIQPAVALLVRLALSPY